MKPAALLWLAFLPFAAHGQHPAPKYNDVMTAVVVGDRAGLQELLALGKWPDKPDSRGRTPLVVALDQGRSDLAADLLAAGADLDRSKAVARRVNDRQLLAEVDALAAHASVGATRK